MEKWAGQSHFKCSSVRGNYKDPKKILHVLHSHHAADKTKYVFYCWLDNSHYEQVLLHY